MNNRWQFSDDLTWVKGRHTLKSGFEFRYHDFPFRGWAVGSVAGEFHFNRLGTAGFDADGNNLGPDRRSVRIVPARAGSDREPNKSR